ncbi:MAG: serine protease [Bacteroidota bacterium]
MADALINLLQSRTVLIRAGKAVGTGTLIAPGMVLTCAHVIRHAWGNNKPILVSLPDLMAPGQFVWEETALSVNISKIYEETVPVDGPSEDHTPKTLKTEYPDVAVIEIEQKDHALIELPFNDNITGNLLEGQYLAFGFQKREAQLDRNVPQTINLTYEGLQVDGIIKKLMFTHGLVRPGMSGAALVERRSGKIVGLVHMTRSSNDNLGAYVIPTEVIWDVIKKWEGEGESKLYSLLRSKQHQLRLKKEYYKEYPRYPMLKKYGVRLLVFLVLLVLFLWWYSYHIGQPQNSGLFAVILTALSIGGIFIGNWLGNDVRDETQAYKTSFGKWVLKSSVLIVLSLIIFSLWNFNSSIWIYGNSQYEEIPVTMYTGDDFKKGVEQEIDSTGKIRFFLPIVFKGDSVKLVPKGSEPKFVKLKPYSRRVLYYPKDFLLEPVIIIRFHPAFLKLIDKYKFHLEVDKANAPTGDHKFIHIDSTLTNEGSLVLGARHLEFRKDKEDEWIDFFGGKVEITTIKEWIAQWKNAKRYTDIDLDLGDKVKIIIMRKSDGSTVNEQSYSINTDNVDKLIKFKF